VFITMDVKLKGWSSATIKVVGESPILRLRPCIALRQFCEGFRREREGGVFAAKEASACARRGLMECCGSSPD